MVQIVYSSLFHLQRWIKNISNGGNLNILDRWREAFTYKKATGSWFFKKWKIVEVIVYRERERETQKEDCRSGGLWLLNSKMASRSFFFHHKPEVFLCSVLGF
jgi:hypothetical protein